MRMQKSVVTAESMVVFREAAETNLSMIRDIVVGESQEPGARVVEISDPDRLVRNPVLSVVMITYNHAAWISHAIEGVLQQQTQFPYELIVADDCSADGTREVVLGYQRRHPSCIRLLTAEKNVGGTLNWQRAARAARGLYMAFCEGDDLWHNTGKIEKQIGFLEANPGFGVIHCDADWYYVRTGQRFHSWNHYHTGTRDGLSGDQLYRAILAGNYYIAVCTPCVRRELFARITRENPFELQTNAFPMQDIPCFLELARICQFKYLDESLATHNILRESMSKSEDPRRLVGWHRAGQRMRLHYVEKYGGGDELRKQVIAMTSRSLMALAHQAADAQLAAEVWAELRASGVRPDARLRLRYVAARRRIIGASLKRLSRARRWGEHLVGRLLGRIRKGGPHRSAPQGHRAGST